MENQLNIPDILCIGDEVLFKSLFDRINTELKTNQTYLKALNKIYIVQNEINLNNYNVKIDTKYYDLELNLEINISDLNTRQNLDKIQGVFILIDENENDFNNRLFLIKNFIQNLNDSCLFILIKNSKQNETNKEVEKFLDEHDNFIDLNIDLITNKSVSKEEENEFSDLDELINSIFVHSWNGIKLKTDKIIDNQINKPLENEVKNELKDDKNLENDELNDEEFNFENLLMNLKEMREKASSLSFEERKKYAENVAINFWKTIGGDLDELDDLNDDVDDY